MKRRGFLGNLLALVFGWKVFEEVVESLGEPLQTLTYSPYLTDTNSRNS